MRTAVCSGSFDPITLGHLDIITRAAACFEKVYVCVSPNAEKKNQMFTPEQKLLLVRRAVEHLPNVEAELYGGLLADYAAAREAVIVRGIRNMVEKEAYCTDILTQVSAIQSALNAFSRELLSNHIHTCVVSDIQNGHMEVVDDLLVTIQKLMK